MSALTLRSLKKDIEDLATRCRCTKIRIVEVDGIVPDLEQPNTIQVLTNGETWFVACDGEVVLLGSSGDGLTCADVLECLGVDTLAGDPTLFFNEQGNFVAAYTDEQAQDAVGGMVDTTLVYVDGTPLLQRAALTGAVTASAGSNTTALGTFTKAELNVAVSDGDVLYVGDVAVGAGLAFGSDNQIPFTNATTNDFDYSSNFTFNSTGVLGVGTIPPATVTGADSGLFFGAGGAIQYRTTAVNQVNLMRGLYFDTTAANYKYLTSDFGLLFQFDQTGGFAVWTAPSGIAGGVPTLTNRFSLKNDGLIGMGIFAPDTNLHIQEANTDTKPTVEIEQLSSGDAGIQFSIAGDSYAVGIDNSDSDLFKISYASTAGTAVLGTNDFFTISSAGVVDIPVSLKVNAIVNDTGLAAGTYTPTRSAEVNMDANVTPTEAQYMRVGNTVTVSGRFTADPTLTATTTSFEITLPVASDIGAVEDVAGVAFCGTIAGQGAAIFGSVANNTAVIQWISGDVTAQSWSFTFSYQVI